MKFTPKLLIKLVIGTAMVMSILTFQGMHATTVLATSQCLASSCNDLDPTSTVGPHNVLCNKNAYLQEHKDYSFGWIENWWSQECNANWTVVNANAGNSITMAMVAACNGTPGWSNPGDFPNFTCNGSLTAGITFVCDTVPNGSFEWCTYLRTDIPVGATHFYTNMVRGNQPTVSAANILTSDGRLHELVSGWH